MGLGLDRRRRRRGARSSRSGRRWRADGPSRLRGQFGPEYDRTLETTESRREAEAELAAREERHEQLDDPAALADDARAVPRVVASRAGAVRRRSAHRRRARRQPDPVGDGRARLPGRGLRAARRGRLGRPPGGGRELPRGPPARRSGAANGERPRPRISARRCATTARSSTSSSTADADAADDDGPATHGRAGVGRCALHDRPKRTDHARSCGRHDRARPRDARTRERTRTGRMRRADRAVRGGRRRPTLDERDRSRRASPRAAPAGRPGPSGSPTAGRRFRRASSTSRARRSSRRTRWSPT